MRLDIKVLRTRPALLTLAGASISLAAVLVVSSLLERPVAISRKDASPTASLKSVSTKRPPWIYGRTDARFTIIGYSDLACPYCREHFFILRHWIGEHPEVNWQWHHLPLAAHEPRATQMARLAECAGEVSGNAGFWTAVAWIYEHGSGDDTSAETDAQLPRMSSKIEECLRSTRADQRIGAQADAAARDHITATPTLLFIDRQTGKTLTLRGPVAGDALLSAIDWLVAPSTDALQASK